MKLGQIVYRVVREIAEEYGIPEEEVWRAAMKLKEKEKKSEPKSFLN